MSRRRLALAALALAFAPAAGAAQGILVVRAARMLDVVKGEIVSPGLVTIQGDRILSVGRAP
jgi:adenine deaminase